MEERKNYERRNRKALALIGLHIGDLFLPHIIKASDSYQLWEELKEYNTQRTQSHRLFLFRQLQNIKLE